MGKLTWQQLGMIYEGSFGVDPKEAAEILSDHFFESHVFLLTQYHWVRVREPCLFPLLEKA